MIRSVIKNLVGVNNQSVPKKKAKNRFYHCVQVLSLSKEDNFPIIAKIGSQNFHEIGRLDCIFKTNFLCAAMNYYSFNFFFTFYKIKS